MWHTVRHRYMALTIAQAKTNRKELRNDYFEYANH